MTETLTQQRLNQAYELVNNRKDGDSAKDYGRLCHRFPMMVLQSGLVVAVMFLESKADTSKAHRHILNDVRVVLNIASSHDPLSRELGKGGAMVLMDRTREVLRTWAMMKRFAVSILKVEDGHDDDRSDG